MQERMNVRQIICRAGRMLYMTDTGQVRCKTEQMQDQSDAGHTVIKAFLGLVIFHATAGNITSFNREIYAHQKSLLYTDTVYM